MSIVYPQHPGTVQVESKVLDFSAGVEAIGDPPAILPPTGILLCTSSSFIRATRTETEIEVQPDWLNQSRHAVGAHDACQAGFPVGGDFLAEIA